MPTTIERITITLIWAVAVTGTLVIAIAASLPSAAVIAVVEIGLAGLIITLLVARWRRRKNELGLLAV